MTGTTPATGPARSTDRATAPRTAPVPARASARRRIGPEWLPRQHGAWAMLVVPALVGAWRGGFAWLQLVLAVAMLAAYGVANAGGLAVRARNPARYLRPIATYGAVACVFALAAVVVQPTLLAWLVGFLPLGFLTAVFTWRRRERSLFNDAATMLAACLFAGVTYQAGSGHGSGAGRALGGWPVMAWVIVALFAYFFGTALYVKTVIRERHNLGFHRVSVGYHAAWAAFWALSALVGVPIRGWTAAALAILFVALTARAKVMAGRRVKPLYVGLGEIGFSAVLAVVLILW